MTFRQALTLAAFFTGFAVHAQATTIADDDPDPWKLHRNGTQNGWTPNSLIDPPQSTANKQTGPAPNILKERMPNIRNETGGFAIYFSRDNGFEYFHESIDGSIGGLYESIPWNHGSANNSNANTPWLLGFTHSIPIKAWVLISHLDQLLYTGKPFTHGGSQKNTSHHAIEANAPLLSFGDTETRWPMHDANAEDQVNPISIMMPEPASLALLLLGLLGLAVIFLQHERALLLCPSAEPFDHKPESKSRFSSARLLRRDVRNNILLFKFLHQRKYTVL